MGENDAGNTTVTDYNCRTGVKTRKHRLYWHNGTSKVSSAEVDDAMIADLVNAADFGSDDSLDTEGVALLGGFWTDQVIARSVTPLPQGETVSMRDAMREVLRDLSP